MIPAAVPPLSCVVIGGGVKAPMCLHHPTQHCHTGSVDPSGEEGEETETKQNNKRLNIKTATSKNLSWLAALHIEHCVDCQGA